MFGAGLPITLQNKDRLEPSLTIWLSLYDVICGGLEGKNTPIYGFDIDSLLQYENYSQ